MIKSILAMQNALHLDGISRRTLGGVAGEFAEGTFVFIGIEQKVALDGDFRMGWNFNGAGHAFDDLQGLAKKPAGDFIFIRADGAFP